ncbi:hypothetical protein I4U23_017056 [Adineta vaga]|nr:hypothetical protein I4U23_017056 [Adineta vaga]
MTVVKNEHKEGYICHRGISIRVRTLNKTESKCMCPPSTYGYYCQYQSQRVSLTVQVRSNTDWLSMFTLVFLLINDQNEIESYDYRYYSSITDCVLKWNIYLLYRTRPKDPSKNYTVRIYVYKRQTTGLEYLTSWHYPLHFSFLPVQRLAVQIVIPSLTAIIQENICSLDCNKHGSCIVANINTRKKTFLCRCDPGYYGIYCQYTQNLSMACSCAPNSLCIRNYPTSICICPLGRGGPKCWIKTDHCQGVNNCQNGGQCTTYDERQRWHASTCVCPEDYRGPLCELPLQKFLITFHYTIQIPSLIHSTNLIWKAIHDEYQLRYEIALFKNWLLSSKSSTLPLHTIQDLGLTKITPLFTHLTLHQHFFLISNADDSIDNYINSSHQFIENQIAETISTAQSYLKKHTEKVNDEKQKVLNNQEKFKIPPSVDTIMNAIENRQLNMIQRAQYNLQQTLKILFPTNNINEHNSNLLLLDKEVLFIIFYKLIIAKHNYCLLQEMEANPEQRNPQNNNLPLLLEHSYRFVLAKTESEKTHFRAVEQALKTLNIQVTEVYQSNVLYICHDEHWKQEANIYIQRIGVFLLIGEITNTSNNDCENILKAVNNDIISVLHHLCLQKAITTEQYEQMMYFSQAAAFQINELYFIPEVYNKEIILQPMLKSFGHEPTKAIARFVNILLEPIYQQAASSFAFITGTDAIRAFENYAAQGYLRSTLFITIQVHDFSTIFSHDFMIEALEQFLEIPTNNRQIKGGTSTTTIIELIIINMNPHLENQAEGKQETSTLSSINRVSSVENKTDDGIMNDPESKKKEENREVIELGYWNMSDSEFKQRLLTAVNNDLHRKAKIQQLLEVNPGLLQLGRRRRCWITTVYSLKVEEDFWKTYQTHTCVEVLWLSKMKESMLKLNNISKEILKTKRTDQRLRHIEKRLQKALRTLNEGLQQQKEEEQFLQLSTADQTLLTAAISALCKENMIGQLNEVFDLHLQLLIKIHVFNSKVLTIK